MHRCIARGAEGEWAGGPNPPPCGQLTRCFSAVAELLVCYIMTNAVSSVNGLQ